MLSVDRREVVPTAPRNLRSRATQAVRPYSPLTVELKVTAPAPPRLVLRFTSPVSVTGEAYLMSVPEVYTSPAVWMPASPVSVTVPPEVMSASAVMLRMLPASSVTLPVAAVMAPIALRLWPATTSMLPVESSLATDVSWVEWSVTVGAFTSPARLRSWLAPSVIAVPAVRSPRSVVVISKAFMSIDVSTLIGALRTMLPVAWTPTSWAVIAPAMAVLPPEVSEVVPSD